ncbi:tRNA (cytidine/uridine-2'-O-)-methyltransferase [Geothermobacter ehrlichii]|uniref:Putative tRNA (cytidine(34)-2'-O)-methyltransferase n=1 Tax=Geothermobacter ehrlichii TaxID=213224 RepID=A0A5D3WPL1_9BACT|nr:tRNA (cytidine(34)-2'-O)-methyltransferase [Geothermobacter ehrlichii]TYP00147.1 tRNA (cytidine/uridine-2'-O-)-methyltransferase [Geothermobacter ehrlichii]
MNNPPLHIVLIEPEIPPNTGNIARLCAATGIALHLVEPLGFSLDDRHLKRAGLDYWPAVNLNVWPCFEELCRAHPGARFWFASKKAERCYTKADFAIGDFLVFGKETLGLPDELLAAHSERTLRIPIPTGKVRSLNLSTAVGIVSYEALRQIGLLH